MPVNLPFNPEKYLEPWFHELERKSLNKASLPPVDQAEAIEQPIPATETASSFVKVQASLPPVDQAEAIEKPIPATEHRADVLMSTMQNDTLIAIEVADNHFASANCEFEDQASRVWSRNPLVGFGAVL